MTEQHLNSAKWHDHFNNFPFNPISLRCNCTCFSPNNEKGKNLRRQIGGDVNKRRSDSFGENGAWFNHTKIPSHETNRRGRRRRRWSRRWDSCLFCSTEKLIRAEIRPRLQSSQVWWHSSGSAKRIWCRRVPPYQLGGDVSQQGSAHYCFAFVQVLRESGDCSGKEACFQSWRKI